jgi:hypothetical protein
LHVILRAPLRGEHLSVGHSYWPICIDLSTHLPEVHRPRAVDGLLRPMFQKLDLSHLIPFGTKRPVVA